MPTLLERCPKYEFKFDCGLKTINKELSSIQNISVFNWPMENNWTINPQIIKTRRNIGFISRTKSSSFRHFEMSAMYLFLKFSSRCIGVILSFVNIRFICMFYIFVGKSLTDVVSNQFHLCFWRHKLFTVASNVTQLVSSEHVVSVGSLLLQFAPSLQRERHLQQPSWVLSNLVVPVPKKTAEPSIFFQSEFFEHNLICTSTNFSPKKTVYKDLDWSN